LNSGAGDRYLLSFNFLEKATLAYSIAKENNKNTKIRLVLLYSDSQINILRCSPNNLRYAVALIFYALLF